MGLCMRAKTLWNLVPPVLLIPAAAWILWQEVRPPSRPEASARDRTVAVTATALPGNGAMLGPFRLSGALALTSSDTGFGGISGLAAMPDGRLLAVGDAGQWLMLRPVVQAGRLAGVADVRMGAFSAATDKAAMDGEAIVLSPGGRTLISLEQQHRILVFEGRGPPRKPARTMFRTAAAGWPPNGGGEALALLPDGAMLWISEQARRRDGAHVALFTRADGTTVSVGIPGVAGFSPTDATVLDGGRLLLLHRLYNGVESQAAISVVDLSAIVASGDTAAARTLVRWGRRSQWPVDNMEGMTVAQEGGKPVLYLVSDDNFNPAQRTLLLRLELAAPIPSGPAVPH